MEPSPQEVALSSCNRVFGKLLHGWGYSKKLEDIFASHGKNPNLDGDLTLDLVEKVRRSFEESLSELGHEVESEDISQVVVVDSLGAVKGGKPRSSEGSEGSDMSSLPTRRDRRGCYKRRSKGETWTEITPSMNADHHQWRKYGEKSIQKAAHPRNYFRCSHKTDQGCLATKQVQKIANNPLTFRTVYQGRHTCNDNHKLKSPEVAFHDDRSRNPGNGDSPLVLGFDRSKAIGSPSNKEVTCEEFCRNNGTVALSASSHHGSYMDMMMGWDDPADSTFY